MKDADYSTSPGRNMESALVKKSAHMGSSLSINSEHEHAENNISSNPTGKMTAALLPTHKQFVPPDLYFSQKYICN